MDTGISLKPVITKLTKSIKKMSKRYVSDDDIYKWLMDRNIVSLYSFYRETGFKNKYEPKVLDKSNGVVSTKPLNMMKLSIEGAKHSSVSKYPIEGGFLLVTYPTKQEAESYNNIKSLNDALIGNIQVLNGYRWHHGNEFREGLSSSDYGSRDIEVAEIDYSSPTLLVNNTLDYSSAHCVNTKSVAEYMGVDPKILNGRIDYIMRKGGELNVGPYEICCLKNL